MKIKYIFFILFLSIYSSILFCPVLDKGPLLLKANLIISDPREKQVIYPGQIPSFILNKPEKVDKTLDNLLFYAKIEELRDSIFDYLVYLDTIPLKRSGCCNSNEIYLPLCFLQNGVDQNGNYLFKQDGDTFAVHLKDTDDITVVIRFTVSQKNGSSIKDCFNAYLDTVVNYVPDDKISCVIL